jgi:hypothetical protein
VNSVIKDIIGRIMITERVSDQKIVEKRLRICHNCPGGYLKGPSCIVCDCFVELKAESLTNRTGLGTYEVTHCPMGYWGDKEIADYYKSIKKSKK